MSYNRDRDHVHWARKCLSPIDPPGDEGLIKVVDHFQYLGAFCSANGTNVKELNSRTGKASAAFRELEKVWRDRNISLDTKLKFYNACVLSTLLYACECWTLTEHDEARRHAFDMRCQRKILRLSYYMVLAYYKQLHKVQGQAAPAYGSH